MAMLERPNARIFYETSGDQGSWITLINGHTRTSKDFKLLVKHLVTNGHRALTMDNRGAGQTETSAPFTIQEMAKDVIALWDYLEIEQSHLLGISMGGMIAQLIAAEHPERVKRLILVSTAARKKWVDPHAETGWGSTLDSVKAKLTYYFAASFIAKNRLLVEAMAKQILKEIEAGTFSEATKSQREAMSHFEGFSYLSKILAETLIIHGREDRVMAPEAARELHEHIRYSRSELIDGAGHLLLAEAPKELYNLVSDFMTEVYT